jgi:hypothetical protein
MPDLLTAAQAREKYNKKVAGKLDNSTRNIVNLIERAIENEECEITVDEYIALYVKELLKTKGYNVRYGGQCDSPYTRISW